MNNLKNVLVLLFASSIFGCSGGGSGNGSGGDTQKNISIQGKSPEDFFAQFYVNVLDCGDPNKSQMLRFVSAVDSTISTMIDAGNGKFFSFDLYITSSKHRIEVEVLKKSGGNGFSTTTKSKILGFVKLTEDVLELTDTNGQLIAKLKSAFSLNGEDLLSMELLPQFKASLPMEVQLDLSPVFNQKMVVKTIRSSLSLSEKNIGCSQGVEALVFN